MSASDARGENDSGIRLNIVILYDGFDFASKAKAMIAGVALRPESMAGKNFKLWSLDELEQPPVAEAALAAAVDAQLIVLAVGRAEPLSATLLGWLEKWAKCRHISDAALAVFDDANPDALSAPDGPELRQLALNHGLSSIFDEAAPAEGGSTLLVHGLHGLMPVEAASLSGHLKYKPHDHYMGWGINE